MVDKGKSSFDNAEYVSTAVGCSQTVNVKFGSGLDATSSPTISMCERDAEGVCRYKSGVILNQFQRDCCTLAFVKRSRSCIAPTMADDPNSIFQCIQLSYTIEPGHTTAHVTFFGSYGSDLVNGGQVEACLVAFHGNGTQVLPREGEREREREGGRVGGWVGGWEGKNTILMYTKLCRKV